MKKEQSGIRCAVMQQKAPLKHPAARLCRSVCGLLFLAGCVGTLSQGQTDVWLIGLTGGTVYLCTVLLLRKNTAAERFLPAVSLLLLIFCILGHQTVQSGAAALLNNWVKQLSVSQHTLTLLFASDTSDMLPTLLILVSIAALLTAWSIEKKPVLLTALCVLLLAGSWMQLFSGIWLLTAIAALLGIWVTESGRLWQRGIAAIGAAMLLALAVLPFRTWADDIGSHWNASIGQQVHALRYDSGKPSMPEGQLSQVGAWKKGEQTALTVTAEQPQKLYLRGYVGEYYNGSAWTDTLPAEQLKSANDLFYWLHKDAFTAQTQLAAGMKTAGIGTEQQMCITTENACKKWAYLPYGLADTTVLQLNHYPDSGVLQGENNPFSVRSGSLSAWYQTQLYYAEQQDADSTRALESAYRTFVYDNYLKLPEDTADTIGQLMQTDGGEMTLPEIQTAIREFLHTTMTYDETVSTDCGGSDFTTYVLTGQKSGYSVHYAAIAACMLRYYGVPARYIEGYYLSAEEAAQQQANTAIVLDEVHAHAWAEFYLDGVGWIPFEVTPNYIDDEETQVQGLLEDPNSALHQALSQSDAAHQYTVPQAKVQQPQREKNELHSTEFDWRMLFVLPLLFLLIFFARCSYRRYRLCRFLRKMDTVPAKEAIVGLYEYSRHLLKLTAFSWSAEALEWKNAERLYQEALFSRHSMTEEQREQQKNFLEQAKQYCRAHWSIPQRLYYSWVHGIYTGRVL